VSETIGNNPFNEESLPIFIDIYNKYLQSGEKEVTGALELFDVLFDFYQESEESLEELNCILNDATKLNIKALMQSDYHPVVVAAAKLLRRVEGASIEFVDILIDGFLKHGIPLDVVFSIMLKNSSEWSGYNKDIVLDFIRNSIPSAPFNTAKIGVKLFISFCNLAEEWDYQIASALTKFALEEDMTVPILNTFIACLSSLSEFNESEKEEMESIISDLTPIAEEAIQSKDTEVSEAALLFLSAIEPK
jgi:hypothetical protein